MNASTTHFASHHLTYSYGATSYSSYKANGVPPPSEPVLVGDNLDDLALVWNHVMTDEPSMYAEPSSVHQHELDYAQQAFGFPAMANPMPLLSTHPSDVPIPPGPYDIGSHYDLRYPHTRLHFQYDAMTYDTASIQCHPTISPSSVAPREPEAFSVPCVAPTLITSLVPDVHGDPPVHRSPMSKPSEAYHHRHISPHDLGDVHPAVPSSAASPLHSSYSLSPSPEPAQSRPRLVVSKRRNVHVPTPPSTPGSSSPTTTMTTNRWKCPYCPHVQRNHRSPDLKRHVATHTRSDDDASWVCCGVPVIDTLECGVQKGFVREENVYEYKGMFMIGGCRKTFSRKDAYVRHLRRERGKCFGDADAECQVGNRAGMGES